MKRIGMAGNCVALKRKGTARNCQAPNWNCEETKSFVMQCDGKAMMSLERLWNSMVLK